MINLRVGSSYLLQLAISLRLLPHPAQRSAGFIMQIPMQGVDMVIQRYHTIACKKICAVPWSGIGIPGYKSSPSVKSYSLRGHAYTSPMCFGCPIDLGTTRLCLLAGQECQEHELGVSIRIPQTMICVYIFGNCNNLSWMYGSAQIGQLACPCNTHINLGYLGNTPGSHGLQAFMVKCHRRPNGDLLP